MTPLIAAGLALLPKIPDMWDAVAGIFGKKTPKTIKEAGSLASEVIDAFKKGEVPPEMQVELEKEINRHKEKMAEMALEEKKMQYKITEMEYGNVEDMIDLEKASYKSDDTYVKRTRPMILRKLFIACIGFVFYAPLFILACQYATISPSTLVELISIIKWIGGWLFGVFASAYLGYTTARSMDKKVPEMNGHVIDKIKNKILKME